MVFANESVMAAHLAFLYGPDRAAGVTERLLAMLADFTGTHPELLRDVPAARDRLTERDAILITYGDQFREPGRPTLVTLEEVLKAYAQGPITGVHILPFYPYSSDDGFSVIDYASVDPDLGDWPAVESLGGAFRLMFDAVINHISRESAWFQAFLTGDSAFADAFIVVEPDTDLSAVVRPRALPLLTAVRTASGEKLVWTTFSTDQIDLNFADPGVLLRIIDLLLLYVSHGAEIIRLDAIAYLWKTIGTPCIHLEQTHRVVKLFRAVLDAVAPGVMLITETNVPHEENLSYFGNGTDEAQLVYQFPLPPLVLHTILTGDATVLTAWAADLRLPSDQTTFYNFLASHDGVGVRPVEGLLLAEQVQAMVDATLAHGGHASYKANPDGSQSVYELNISYFDALNDPQSDEPLAVQVDRFMVSQSVMLTLQGVPAIYVHSFFGSRNYPAGVAETGRYRSINREKLDRSDLDVALADPASLRSRVYTAYRRLLTARQASPAFHPNGRQTILDAGAGIFAVLRSAPQGDERVLCLHNVTGEVQVVSLDTGWGHANAEGTWADMLSDRTCVAAGGRLALSLMPYQVMWLRSAG